MVTGEGKSLVTEAIFQVLKPHFRVKRVLIEQDLDFSFITLLENEVFLLETNSQYSKKLEWLLNSSSLPILVVTHLGEIPLNDDFFASDLSKAQEITKLAKALPARGFLVLNFDDETVRSLNKESLAHPLTFGFQEGADIRANNIRLNTGTNFKITYKGNIVPVWLEKLFGKEQVYSALVAAAIGVIFDLNLVEISQALKKYQGLAGKMRLIKGVKKSWILDNSKCSSVNNMIEALDILGRLEDANRKIAVLGDIVGLGQYAIEAHETIGEKAARVCDLLFTFGPRANFTVKEAEIQGLSLEKIFHFAKIEDGKLELQERIEEGDVVLVSGSPEMAMEKIIEEIKEI